MGDEPIHKPVQEPVVEGFAVGALEANCYLIVCPQTGEAMIVDPGDEAERVLARVRERGVQVARILHTHGHFDHINATEALLAELGASIPVLAHGADAYLWFHWQAQVCHARAISTAKSTALSVRPMSQRW